MNLQSAPRFRTGPLHQLIEWIKLNSDGVSKGNPGVAGGSGVFRDSTGSFVHAYAFKCAFGSAITAEHNAVLHGLQIAFNQGFSKPVVEIDSSEVCCILETPIKEFHANYHLVNRCRELLRNTLYEVKLSKIRRQSNEAADKLANWSLTSLNLFT